jgi:PTS hybrid protein
LVDAPFVEGAVAAAVMSSAGQSLEDVARAAEEARGASKF